MNVEGKSTKHEFRRTLINGTELFNTYYNFFICCMATRPAAKEVEMAYVMQEGSTFEGMAKKDDPVVRNLGNRDRDRICPICEGYGGWKRPSKWSENRLQGIHCSQCNGWGWVAEKDEACAPHEMKELSQADCRKRGLTHWGMCWHVYECAKCGVTRSYDSSG